MAKGKRKLSIATKLRRKRDSGRLRRLQKIELTDSNKDPNFPFIKIETLESNSDFEDGNDSVPPDEFLNVKVEESEDIPSDYFEEVGITFENEDCEDDNSGEKNRRSSRTPQPSRQKTETKMTKTTAKKKQRKKIRTPKPKYKKVSEMTPEEYKRYQEEYKRRYKYKKVSEMTPVELEAYKVYKEKVKSRYHMTKAVKIENPDGEGTSKRPYKHKPISEMTLEEFQAYENKLMKKRKRPSYYKKVSDLSPKELKAYEAKKEKMRLRSLALKAEGKSLPKKKRDKRVSEMTPKELEAYSKQRERMKLKYKKLSERDPEEKERVRARWKEKYQQRKAEMVAKMSEEERAKYLEKEEKRAARRLKVEAKKLLPKRPRKKRGEGKTLDPEEEQRKKREMLQRMAMKRIEKRAQMTEEEKEEERQRHYMNRVARLSALTPEELEIRNKRKQEANRKYNMRRREKYHKLIKEGKNVNIYEIRRKFETPEARERRCARMRITGAKRRLRDRLVAEGVHPEEIERQVEHLAKTYVPMRSLRPYKPMRRTLLKPIEPEETSSFQRNSALAIPPTIAKTKPVVARSDYSFMPTLSFMDQRMELYTTLPTTSSSQNQCQLLSTPTHTIQSEPNVAQAQSFNFNEVTNSPPSDYNDCDSDDCGADESPAYDGIASSTVSSASEDNRNIHVAANPVPSGLLFSNFHQSSCNSGLNNVVGASSSQPSIHKDDGGIANHVQDNARRTAAVCAPTHFSAYHPVFASNQIVKPPIERPSLPSSSLPPPEKRAGRPVGVPSIQNRLRVKRDCICDICGHAYQKSDLLQHKRRLHHPYYKNGHCLLCSQRFKLHEFVAHFKIHVDNGDVDLKSLDKVFHPSFRRSKNSGEKTSPCHACGQLLTRGGMYSHLKRYHNPYYDEKAGKCTLCEKEVSESSMYYQHFMDAHPGVKIEMKSKIPLQEKPYKCDECEARYTTSFILQDHKYYAHGAGSFEENWYRCQECPEGKVFQRKSLFVRHYKQVHPGKYAPLIRCPLCPTMLGSERDNREHLKDKHPDRCWPCQYCNVVRTTEIGILSHYSRQCPKITPDERVKWAAEKGDVVTVDKMVGTCELCGVKCILESLSRHYRDNHGIREVEHPCWRCEKSFKMRFYLGVHLIEFHDLKPEEWLEGISKFNVPDKEAVKANAKPYNPANYRKKKRRGHGKGKNADSVKERAKSGPKRKKGRQAKSRPRMADSEEELESNAEPSESEAMSESENDDNNSDFSGTKESSCTELNKKRMSSRNVKRRSFKEYYNEDEEENISSDWGDALEVNFNQTNKRPNMLIVKDDKLNTMRSSVVLRKMGLETLCLTNQIQICDRSDLEHVFV